MKIHKKEVAIIIALNCSHIVQNTVRRYAKQLCTFVLSVTICNWAAAENFVPFVIPAKPSPDSAIAVPSTKPIDTDGDRLVADGHFYRGGQRVRLWGVNLSFGANFPKHQDAPYIAERLAVAGVNTVRCHHMDTARWPRGIWNAKDGKTISPEALDRLDYFIDQLARHGIFVNINLHVGRAHSQYLDLSKTNREYDKISNIFTPALVDAQKQYARELLTRVNKYRKVRYADDPAVAIVEVTNENSFFMWDGENTLRTLPGYYADILRSKFNAWLNKQYGSDEKLRRAWAEGAEPLGENLLANGDFQRTAPGTALPESWRLEQHGGCKASASRQRHQSKDALRIEIAEADDVEWHLQLNQAGLSLKAGHYYTAQFAAAAETPRRITCSVGQAHEPWNNLGLSQRVELTDSWQTFRYGFVARADEDNARLSFSFGGSKIPFYLANVQLRPGGRVGLHDDESAKTANVALFGDSETPARTLDRMVFLAETEKAYFDGMRDFIKGGLGCKALVTGTIVFGPLGLYAQSDMDFIDAHAYWQHPRFPGRPWDSRNWVVEQRAMTDYPDQATLFRLAAERLLRRPFTVSEYNHPAPLDSQAECVPMIASFAAAQDWDGVWLYTYSHATDGWDREVLSGYFDVDTNPAKWGFMRAGTAVFRDSGPPHAGINQLDVFVCVPLFDSADIVTTLANLHLKHDRDMLGVLAEKTQISWADMLKRQIVPSIHGWGGQSGLDGGTRLQWSVTDGKGLYAVRGRGAWVYTGHAERLQAATDGTISVAKPEFVALTVTALDKMPLDESRKILITACGRCENTGMEFSQDRRTVGTNWGGPPVQIEAVQGTVELDGRWKCQALGPDGVPKQDVAVFQKGGKSRVGLSPEHKTMWYLLTRPGP